MDKETRALLLALSREVQELSTLLRTNMEADDDKEKRLRKVERWMYGLPVAYVLTLATVFTSVARMGGKA